MHNTDEKFVITAGMVCLCPLIVASLIVPGFGYFLLGVVVLGVVSLIIGGVAVWWETRFAPENLPRRASREAAARIRQAQQQIDRKAA